MRTRFVAVGSRRVRVQVGGNFRSKPHPWWFVRTERRDGWGTFQSGPLSVWW